jgi:hypothetical protein
MVVERKDNIYLPVIIKKDAKILSRICALSRISLKCFKISSVHSQYLGVYSSASDIGK